MTENQENNQDANQTAQNDKELNFRKLEAKYQQQLEQERREREAALKKVQQEYEEKLKQFQKPAQDDDDDDDYYVDRKRLQRSFSDFERNLEEKFDKKAEEKAKNLIAKQQQEMWVKNHPDFYDVLQNHADEFAKRSPELAEDILSMPDGFAKQKTVYHNIKALGLDKPKEDVQQKIDNRSGAFYQPSNVATGSNSPMQGDFSPEGQKKAYQHVQQLKSRLRL